MGGNIALEHTTRIKMALGHNRQAVAVATTTLVSTDGEIDETLFRHFSQESLIRLNELLDNPDKPLPFLARLVYLMRLSTEGDRPRTQTEIAELIGVTKQVVNHYFVEYFPQFCPRKSVKQIEAGA